MALNPVNDTLIAQLRQALPPAAFPESDAGVREEPRGRWQGQCGLLVAPGSTEEVAHVVRTCHAARVAIVPHGGGTGLVGGQLMPQGQGAAPVVLSLARMQAVRRLDAHAMTLEVEAGMCLQQAQQLAEDAGWLLPLSMASQGSCTIGGNLATNAGGVNVLRYGNARDLCLGVEAVMADGQIFHGLSTLRKDNTGYDLRHLLIGSEGTLGIITAASMRLMPIPAQQGCALFAVPSIAAAQALLQEIRRRVLDGINAFELIHRQSWLFLHEQMPQLRQPFAPDAMPEWCVLVDLGLPAGLEPDSLWADIYEQASEQEWVTDAWLASNQRQRMEFWQLRESIPEANRLIGAVSSHDISLPADQMESFIREAGKGIREIDPALRINCFGHLGDGNLHYNVFPAAGAHRDQWRDRRAEIKRCIHDRVHACGGSISAEHGIGRLKVADLAHYADPAKLASLQAIKQALDPEGILNPGAVLA